MATTIWWPCDLRPRLRWVVPAQDGAANFSNTQHEGRTWHITFEKPPWNLHQSLQYSGCSVEQLASALNVIYPSSPRNAPSSVSRSLYLLPIPYLFKVVEARDMVELEEASTSVAALTSLKSAVLKRKTMPSQWARDKLFQDLSADGWRSTDLLRCINRTTVHTCCPMNRNIGALLSSPSSKPDRFLIGDERSSALQVYQHFSSGSKVDATTWQH